MEMNKRTTIRIKATMPDLQSLKILQGLKVPVQVEATIALAQFYDPPLQCFLFQDFLLAPTLEEFELYVNVPKNKK